MRYSINKKNHIWHAENGSILLESIICLPILLVVALGLMQFAHIWICRTMVQYAAYCGGRAAMTAAAGREAEQVNAAVKVICAPLVFFNPTDNEDFALPGIAGNKKILSSGGVHDKRILSSEYENGSEYKNDGTFNGMVTVRMRIPLLVPFAGPIIGKAMELYPDRDSAGGDYQNGALVTAGKKETLTPTLFSRLELETRVYVTKPYICTWNQN